MSSQWLGEGGLTSAAVSSKIILTELQDAGAKRVGGTIFHLYWINWIPSCRFMF
jgi:hypothetical protein